MNGVEGELSAMLREHVRSLYNAGVTVEQIAKVYVELGKSPDAAEEREGEEGAERESGTEREESREGDEEGEGKRTRQGLEGEPSPKRPRSASSPLGPLGDWGASRTPVLLSHLLGPPPKLLPLLSTSCGSGEEEWRRREFPPPLSLPFPFSQLHAPLTQPEPSAYRPLRPDMDFSLSEHPELLRDLLRRGEEAAIQEMKAFVSQYQLRQTAIATMSGVSQPYISKFLNGNYKELSQRVRTILFNWFVGARQNPEKMVVRVKSGSLGDGPTSADVLLPQRRERYVFRPSLLRILEAHFVAHAYPDLHRRMEIAAECNRALQAEKNGHILSKELVTPQVIANWFANKRKEVKRRVAEGEPMEGVLPALLNTNLPAALSAPLVKGGLHSPPPLLPSSPQELQEPTPAEQGPEERPVPPLFPRGGDLEPESLLKTLQSELEAVNSSVLALINPYGDQDPAQ